MNEQCNSIPIWREEYQTLREKCPYSEFFGVIRNEYGEMLSPNAGKYVPEKLRKWTLFTQSDFQTLNKNITEKFRK